MNNVVLEEKYILEYIKEMINSFQKQKLIIDGARYHHNSSYENASSILKNGILSLTELDRLNIRNSSNNILKIMDDTDSHINGSDGISLSVVGLTDLYKDEEEYDPFRSYMVDFLISSEIKAYRKSTHYGNEFIADRCIENHFIKSADIRILNYFKSQFVIDDIVKKYNFLKEIASTIIKYNLDIPIREMSGNVEMQLDIDKIISTPRLVLKRY